MRGWNAWLWCVLVVGAHVMGVAGCDNEGNISGADAGGTGGFGGSGGSSGNTDDAGRPPPPPPHPCTRNLDCNDGLYCNGEETCVNRSCAAGTPPPCDDGIDCTIDRCVEDRHECSFTARDDDRDGHRDGDCVDGIGESLGDDCDDTDSTRFPGALEVCDADDHDEDCDLETFGRVDADGDGYLNGNCCNTQTDDSLLCGDDCDDSNPRSHPFNTETCDGIDNDCNGMLDHPLEDQDGDGFATMACGGTDCDDFDLGTFAGAMERCDGFDNDCLQGGGVADDETDMDSDAFVSGLCTRMDDVDLSPGDCDEDRPSANPMRPEQCNGRDDDCDGAIDEALSCDSAVKNVDAGRLQTCAVRVNGTVACWGWNGSGLLGTGSDDSWLSYPRSVLDPRAPSLQLSQVAQVAVGRNHACAAHLDGRVSCWGYGAIGSGTTDTGFQAPSAVSGIEDAAQVCAGAFYSCARRADGSVWCWGSAFNGKLGDGSDLDSVATRNVPVQVLGIDDAIDLDCNREFACVATASGSAHCWGRNNFGQLGDLSTTSRATPVEVFGVSDVISVTTGSTHACALKRDGTVYCWGENAYGQIGNQTTSPPILRATQALQYTGYPLDHVVEITAGGGDAYDDDRSIDDGGNTCARMRNGDVLCWGRNHVGQAANGAFVSSSVVPNQLPAARDPAQGLTDSIGISTGHQHSCAIAPDGTLRCWGGGKGQIPGDGTYSLTTAQQVEGL